MNAADRCCRIFWNGLYPNSGYDVDTLVRNRENRPSMFNLLKDIAGHRDLLMLLVGRNLKIRYKNSALGFFWSLLVPLFMIILYAVFLRVMRFDMDLPALVTGIIVWQFLAMCLGDSLYAVLGNANLVTKAAFPRSILPLGMVLANLVNFLLAAAVLLLYVIIDPVPFGNPLWLIPALGCQFMLCMGTSFLISACNVYFRDTEHILSMVMLAWFFMSPIIYPIAMVTGADSGLPSWVPVAYFVNPMTGIVSAYRMALIGAPSPGCAFLNISFVVAIVIGLLGIWCFKRLEDGFGDEL